jgi:hypothetical protein
LGVVRKEAAPIVVSKAEYLRGSGRLQHVIDSQAQRYDLPISTRKIELWSVIRRFHDLLAEFARRRELDDSRPAMKLYREERALIARYDRLARESNLLPRDLVQLVLSRLAATLRGAGEKLGQRKSLSGDAAQQILNEAIERGAEEIQELLDQVRATGIPVGPAGAGDRRPSGKKR